MNENSDYRHPSAADIYAGKKLQIRRKLMGISLMQLSLRVGVSYQQIQKYEKGEVRMSAGRLYEFSRVLKVPINYFFAGYVGKAPQAFEGLPHDVYESREAIALLKSFFAIESAERRKMALRMIEMMGD